MSLIFKIVQPWNDMTEPVMAERMERKTVILPGIKSTLDIGNNGNSNGTTRSNVTITCREDPQSEAGILLSLAMLGITANVLLMILIIIRGRFSRLVSARVKEFWFVRPVVSHQVNFSSGQAVKKFATLWVIYTGQNFRFLPGKQSLHQVRTRGCSFLVEASEVFPFETVIYLIYWIVS